MTSKVLNNFLSVKVGIKKSEKRVERVSERESRIIKVNDINETWLRLFYHAVRC